MQTSYVNLTYSRERIGTNTYAYDFAGYCMRHFQWDSHTRLLDAGCGIAEITRAFVSYGIHASGCDREFLPEHHHGLDIRVCDFTKDDFPFESEFFDVVLSKSVIEHIQEPDLYMREAWRVLKPGGMMIILCPDWQSQWRVFYEDATHVRPYLLSAIKDLLTLYGFSCTEARLFSHHQLLWDERPSIALFWAKMLRACTHVRIARWLTKKTSIKFFRWAVERQVFAVGIKKI